MILKRIWDKWLTAAKFDEFSRVEAIKGQRAKGGKHMTDPTGRRRAIASALADLPVGEWIGFDEFCRYMQVKDYDFLVSNDAWKLYIADSSYGRLDSFGYWEIIEGRYLMAFLMEYTATLGIIDIAYTEPFFAKMDYDYLWGIDDLEYISRYDGLEYLRLNNLGAYCLGLTDTFIPEQVEEQKNLNVLPNFEIVAFRRELPPSDGLFLDRIAAQSSDSVWVLTQKTLLSAIESGLSMEHISEFLSAHSKNTIPENVLDLFNDIERRSNMLKDQGMAKLIEVDSPEVAMEITMHLKLRRNCLLANDRYVVVPEKFENQFRNVLKEMGYVLK